MKIFKDKALYIYLIISILFFGTFIKLNFSVDTYLLFASKNMSYIREFISSGRLLTAGMFMVFQLLRMNCETMYLVSFILATIFNTLSMYELSNITKKYIKNNYIAYILPIMIIINAFVIELWLFVEMSIMMLSILSCVKAFKHFENYLDKKDKTIITKSLLWMVLALFSYQGTVALFVGLSSILIIKHSKNIKEFCKNNLILFMCYIVPTIINFISITIIGNKRVGGSYNLISNIEFIIKSTKEQMINGFGLYKNGIFSIFILASIVIAVTLIIRSKSKIKPIVIAQFLYVILATYIFSVAPLLTQSSTSLAIYPRIVYTFGSIVGIIFLFCYINVKIDLKSIFNNIILSVIVLLLAIEFITFNSIAINRYIVNYMDKYIVYEIQEKINDYEQSTGNKIEHIAVYNLDRTNKFYPELQDMINVSAKNEQPSGTALLVFYMNKKLDVVEENDTIYENYFKNKNWKLFNLDQIVLEGNTMHWYLY